MKKQLSIVISCLLLMAGSVFGQNSIDLYTQGSTTETSMTVAPGSAFSLDTYATFNGFTGIGLSYWLQVPDALAPFLTITSESYFTWTDPNQAPFGTDQFNKTDGTPTGFMNEDRDLGATSVFSGGLFVQAQSAGTYQVSTLNFSLGAGIAPGTYQIQLQTIDPHASEINDDQFVSHFVPQSVYTFTVVPEPSTWSFLALGGLGSVGLMLLRRRRAA